MGEERKVETLEKFFEWFGVGRSGGLRYVGSDMWKLYLRVVAQRAQGAIHVRDRFHGMAKLSKAIDEVRAQEARELAAAGEEPALKNTRWLLLKRPAHRTEKQEAEAGGPAEAQPADGAGVPAQGRFPAVLGMPLADAGPEVPRPLVPPSRAFTPASDGESGEDAAPAPCATAALVPGRPRPLFRRCGGLQQQVESDAEKSVRLSFLQGHGTRFISWIWQSPRTQLRRKRSDGPCWPECPSVGDRKNGWCRRRLRARGMVRNLCDNSAVSPDWVAVLSTLAVSLLTLAGIIFGSFRWLRAEIDKHAKQQREGLQDLAKQQREDARQHREGLQDLTRQQREDFRQLRADLDRLAKQQNDDFRTLSHLVAGNSERTARVEGLLQSQLHTVTPGPSDGSAEFEPVAAVARQALPTEPPEE